MAASEVLIGLGATLSYDTSTTAYADLGTATWTAIAEITEVNPPGFSLGEFDATHHGSTDHTMEPRPALNDPGEVTGTLHFIPANYPTLMALRTNRTPYGWKVETADEAGSADSIATFMGWLKEFKPGGMTVDGKREATFTIRVTSKCVPTAP